MIDSEILYRLKEKINDEFDNIENLLKEAREETAGRSLDSPTHMELRFCGSIVSDFYNGIEEIFKNISILIDENEPKGGQFHSVLLTQMANNVEGKREAVICKEFEKELREYLGFRHVFRKVYGFKLEWKKFKKLFLNLENMYQKLKTEIEQFLIKLEATNKQPIQ
jgi:hypothetical protein